jgi:hypothetical protein
MHASDIDTLILIDVDGVLNVGMKEPSGAPLLLDTHNINVALRRRLSPSAAAANTIARIVSVIDRPLQEINGESATYMDLVADQSMLSPTLLVNLALIILAAGDHCGFVLSSTWRKPGKEALVRTLEMQMSLCLGRHFCFNGRTPMRSERSGVDRLEILGDYLSALQAKRGESAPRLRVLVLDDFGITPLDGWPCQGFTIGSTEDAEAFLKSRAGDDVEVRVVHTYEMWYDGDDKVPVEVGMGLQRQHVSIAHAFFSGHS